MTENDYVATATAEKRLREVLAERFAYPTDLDGVADALLAGAEITYLPRKRTVSILLRYPETVTTEPTVTTKGEPVSIPTDGPGEPDYDPNAGADIPDPVAGRDYMSDSSPTPKVARFGLFQPTVTSAPEYHEDDYFTE